MSTTNEQHVQFMYKYAAQLRREVEAGTFDPERLGRSQVLQWSAVKAIELVGEEAWQLDKVGYDLGPRVNLVKAAGMRHRIVHHYEGVDWNVVEDVLAHDIAPLVDALAAAMAERGIALPDL